MPSSRPSSPECLAQLPCGRSAAVQALNLDAELQTRLQALGVKPGRVIEVLRRAGVGGPLHVRVGGTEFMLRRQQAAHILVQAQAVVPA